MRVSYGTRVTPEKPDVYGRRWVLSMVVRARRGGTTPPFDSPCAQIPILPCFPSQKSEGDLKAAWLMQLLPRVRLGVTILVFSIVYCL